MKSNVVKVFICVLVSLLVSCQRENLTKNDQLTESEGMQLRKEYSKAESDGSKFEHFRMKRHYNALFRPYVTLTKDSLLRSTINSEMAEAIGIPRDIFLQLLEEVEDTNKQLLQMRSKGIFVGLVDPAEVLNGNTDSK